MNKVETYKYFSDYLHHRWLYPKESTFEQFKEFVTAVDKIIKKPLEDQQGHGVDLFIPSGNYYEDFLKCKEDNLLLDECIKQDQRMSFGIKVSILSEFIL